MVLKLIFQVQGFKWKNYDYESGAHNYPALMMLNNGDLIWPPGRPIAQIMAS